MVGLLIVYISTVFCSVLSREDIISSQEKIISSADSISMMVHFRAYSINSDDDNDKIILNRKYIIKLHGNNMLFETINLMSANAKHELVCVNNRYSFTLRKDASRNGWFLFQYSPSRADYDEIEPRIKLYTKMAYMIRYNNSIYNILRSDTTAIRGISYAVSGRKSMCKIEFNRKFNGITDYIDKPVVGGVVYLDPSANYRIASYNVLLKYLSENNDEKVEYMRGLKHYDRIHGSERVVKNEEWFSSEMASRPYARGTHEYTYYNESLSESDFTLAKYGMLEPHGITWERPTPWWIYFGLIGGGCLVGFVLIGVFLRRRYGAS